MKKIQYSGPLLDEEEVQAVAEVIRSGWIGHGPKCREFEQRFAKLVGKKYCILTNSGSSANLLAVEGLVSLDRVPKNTVVATYATAFPTTVNPIIQAGLIPYFLDCSFDHFIGPSYDKLLEASGMFQVMFVSHILGGPSPTHILDYENCIILEDCCDALGATVNGQPIGRRALATTYSFFASHHITMGEGGAVCTDDEELADEMRSLGSWGRACTCSYCPISEDRSLFCDKFTDVGPVSGYSMRYTYRTIGYNLKPTEMQAAIGLIQLKKLQSFLEIREKYFQIYYDVFKDDERLLMTSPSYGEYSPAWMGVPFMLLEGERQNLIDFLEKERGIETRLLFSGCLPDHPAYRRVNYGMDDLSHSREIMRKAFFVGNWPGMTEADVHYVCNSMKEGLDVSGN
jgi:CDP-4-dehydro-6-deoxyglucose reductase, E1